MSLLKEGTPRDSYAYVGEDGQIVFGSALINAAVTEVEEFRLLRERNLLNKILFLSMLLYFVSPVFFLRIIHTLY